MNMSNFEKTQIESDGVGAILKNKLLAVPAYQRSYSWEKQNVSQFFSDVISAFKKGEPEYFLGTIVLVNKDDMLEIVDGQQRLATTAVFIAVIRDYLRNKGDQENEERALLIEKEHLFSKNYKTLESTYHLKLNTADNSFFEKLIDNSHEKAIKSDPRSAKLLTDAANEAREHIAGLAKSDPKIIDTLMDLLEYFRDRVMVVAITVSDTANAFAIFETLNDRGLDLSISDLVKNYLFGLSGDKIEEAKALWVTITATLSPIGDESLLPKLIYYYWLSSRGVITQNSLFGAIKSQVQIKNDSIAFLKQLAEAARHFVAMQSSDDARWTAEASRVAIQDLARIPLDQNQPLLLAIVTKFSDTELQKTLKLMVAWSVRFHVAANTRTSQFREKLSAISQRIHKGEIKTSKALYTALTADKLLPNNADFEKEFAQTSPPQALARYYLSEIEGIARAKAGNPPGLKPDRSPDEVNLEHILPRTVTDFADWPNFNADTKGIYVGRLGNLAILPSKENSKIGNVSFDEKKKVFDTCAFITTKDLSTQVDWSPSTIEQRQKDLAKLAVEAWPLQ